MAFFENKLRFYHTTDPNSDPSTWREVYPLGSKAFEWKKDKKEVFYRQGKKGDFQFSNVTEDGKQVNDFDFFNAINNDILARCEKRFIITQRNCNGTWTTEHIGKFTMNDGKWDLDKCTVELKQNLNDEYSCLKENKKEEYNILNTAPIVTTFSPIQNNFEFLSCRNKDWLANLLPNPCDATGGWKKFYHKVATNSPEPRSTVYTDSAADDYFNGMQGPDLAGWIEESGGSYLLQTRRFSDGNLFPINSLDAQSTAKIDVGMFGWTENALRDFRIFRPEDGLALTIVQNHTADIIWFDIDDDLKYAFYYDGTRLYAYDFSTQITRIVDTVNVSTQLQTLVVKLNISYGDGLLAYHDDDNDELFRYDPQTFIEEVIQENLTQVKFVHSEAGFLTWYDMDQDYMYLQERDDTTRENILLRDNGGDSRYYARENEWLIFDDEVPTGAQICFNLINRDSFSQWTNGGGAFIPANLTYKIENGWFLQAGQTLASNATYLDSRIPGVINSAYEIPSLSAPLQVTVAQSPFIPMAAGVERIYIAGQDSVGGFPQDFKLWSIDQKDNVTTEVENLGPETTPGNILKEIFMNNCEQVLTLSENRVHIYKENIQREDELEVWFREKLITICVGGNLFNPGSGWILYQNQCNQFGTATWVRSPTMAAPPLIDIAQGSCLCTDDVPDLSPDPDDCVSINPNALITDQVLNVNATFLPGTVIGPIDGKQAFGGNPREVTWYIEKPRTGSTYTWSLIAMPGATIQSGQGTDVLVVQLTSAFGGGTISCVETNACHVGPPIAAATIPFIYHPWNGGGVTATISIPILVEADTYSGATVRFIRAFNNPWPLGGSNIVTGESASNFFTDSKNRTVLDATHDGTSGSMGWSGNQGGASFNATVPIVVSPSASLVCQPAEICPSAQQTFRVENPRLGCTYIWTVDAPAFIVAQEINGFSAIIDTNGAVITDQVHLQEVCPVQPVNYQLIAPCDKLNSDSWWWVIGNDVEYDRNRLLKNVIEDLISSICPEITAVRSDLFQWNPLNPSLINYVYGGVNQYNYLTIAQKSDIRTPLSSGAATIGNLTWDQFTKWMINMEVYYIIIDGELHIEHISRFKGTVGLDTTLIPLDEYANNNRQFTYAKAEMSRRETYLFEEALNAEFVGFPIEYKDPNGDFSLCVNDDTEERNWKELTTDLKFIQTNAASISLKGFVILANEFDGLDYRVIEDPGVITNIPILNSPMSVSALQERFMTWNRILPFGWMNRSYRTFDSSQFFKKQESFKIPFCCGEDFDPLDLVKTTLGDGEIESAEIDFETDTIELKLKYE